MKPIENLAFAYSASVIKTKIVRLQLHRTFNGSLLLSSNLAFPYGTVYFATTAVLLVDFLTDQISLQSLFDQSFSGTIEIIHENKSVQHYVAGAIAIILSGVNRTFKELLDWVF